MTLSLNVRSQYIGFPKGIERTHNVNNSIPRTSTPSSDKSPTALSRIKWSMRAPTVPSYRGIPKSENRAHIFLELTHKGDWSNEAKFAILIEAFHRFTDGSPPGSVLLIKSYAFDALVMVLPSSSIPSEHSIGNSERRGKASSRSRPLRTPKSFWGRI